MFGVEVKQPPRLVHEIRKVVEHHEAHAEDARAAVFQSVVLRGDGLGKAQLEVSRATWGGRRKRRRVQMKEDGFAPVLMQEHDLPEFLVEVDGVVHAELWQRPADICLMFFPWSAVTSVASFTRLECPRPSCKSHGAQTGYLTCAHSSEGVAIREGR